MIQQKRANGDTHSKNCKTAAWPRRSKCPSEKATDQRKVYYDWWPIEESSLIRQAFEICNRRFEALFQRPAGLPSERLFRQADVGLTLSRIVGGQGRNSMREEDRVMRMTVSARARTVNSFGLPRLIGPVSCGSVFSIRRIQPSIKSST